MPPVIMHSSCSAHPRSAPSKDADVQFLSETDGLVGGGGEGGGEGHGSFSQASDFQEMQIIEPLLRGECLVPDTQAWSSPHLLQMTRYGYFRVCALRATSGHLLITLVHFAAWILMRI